jgi:tetratricopeptide (TPR) repeat protein
LADVEPAHKRWAAWFLERLPEQEGQGRAWGEVCTEYPALIEWLSGLPSERIASVANTGHRFALACGPYGSWSALCERGLEVPLEPPWKSALLWSLGDLSRRAGDLDRALTAAQECTRVHQERGEEREVALSFGLKADVLQAQGELDEALRIRREEELPVFERLGDVRSLAITWGKIADVLQARGELDEALRIYREEVLPDLERLGEVRFCAVCWGKIADVLQVRGKLDEALRIRREEQLPVYERLGDVRARAVTWGKIADVLQVRGELDEALRIHREEQLPVFERLGDVRSLAVTWGKIAVVLQARGDLDEALRIRREEQLPVYERLGDRRGLLVARANLALALLKRNGRGDRDEATELLRLAHAAAEQMRIPEAEIIRQWQQRHGLPE